MSIDNTRPAYRVLATNGFFGPDDHLYREGEEIYFDGEPNEEMEPLNELARLRIVEFITKLEDESRKIADKLGKPFHGRPRSLDGGLALATELQRNGIAIMGAKKDTSNIKQIKTEETPETGAKRGKGRPKGSPNKAKLSVQNVAA